MQQTKTSGGRAGYVVIFFFNLFPPQTRPEWTTHATLGDIDSWW